MRVLVLSSRDLTHPEWAGGDVYLHRITLELQKLGHKIIIVCNSYQGSKPLSKEDGITIHRVRGSILRPITNLLFYAKLKQLADVVIEEVEGPAGPFFASLFVRRPLVGLWFQPARKIFFAQYPAALAMVLSSLDIIYGKLLRQNFVVVPSLARARDLWNLGISPSRTFVVPGAPDPGPLDFKPLPLSSPFFLTLGKYRTYKCFHHPIMAMKHVVARYPNCHLIVGGGSTYSPETAVEEAKLRKVSIESDVRDCVSFTPLSRGQKNWALSHSVALIVPSPIEGFSLASIEANSFGTPVIASDGVPEDVVIHGLNGLRYKFGRIDELVDRMLFLLENSNRAPIASRAREFSRKFSWQNSAELFIRALEAAKGAVGEASTRQDSNS